MSIKLCISGITLLCSLSLFASQYQRLPTTNNPNPISNYSALVQVMREKRQQQGVAFDFADKKGSVSGANFPVTQSNKGNVKG